ncbi:MAG: zf-HC2 domain-containing protein [Caldilineaceae bacterium]
MNHIDEIELHEYLDGQVAESRRRAIEQHLQTCPTCSEQLAELCSLFAMIQSVPEVALERDLSSAVVASIQSDGQESPGWTWWLSALQLISAAAAIPFAWRFVAALWPAQLGVSWLATWSSEWAEIIAYGQQGFAAITSRMATVSTLTSQPFVPNLPLITWAIVVLVVALIWAGGTGWVLAHNSDRLGALDSRGDSI